ncbi:MAG TPA: hypothetical protein DCW29_14765 [Janthinobacterium sp.]|nr:hypothetical protein [Janthinobacterium sp.]
MLKFTFWLLLAVNVALFALGRGYLDGVGAESREPARVKNQLHAERISLISSASALAPPAPIPPPIPAPAPAPIPVAVAEKPAPKPQVFACTEVGNFAQADARRFESELAPLALGARQSRHSVPGQEVSSYIVFIPPQSSKEAADKKAAELKELGVENYFIMSDNSPMHWAISLGVFKLETGAQNLLAALVKQGVRSARISARYANGKQLTFQFRDLDGATRARLSQIKADFPAQEMHACK